MHKAYLLTRHPEALELAVAWETATVTGSSWADTEFDVLALSMATGMVQNDVLHWLKRLAAAELIFPDGTISEDTKSVLEHAVNKVTGPNSL